MPAQVSSDDVVQLVLGDGQGRQAVVAVVAPHKPDERSVWRRHERVTQMRQYPLLNFTMAKSACAGAVAVRPSASAPIAKRNFFIAHSPLRDALLPPLSRLRFEGLS